MSTRIGFYLFAGAIIGTLVGTQLPFAASYEAIAGGVLAIGLAVFLDKRDNADKAE